MLDRESLEMTVLQMARIQGEKLDRHTLYTVRNEIRNGQWQHRPTSGRNRARLDKEEDPKPYPKTAAIFVAVPF